MSRKLSGKSNLRSAEIKIKQLADTRRWCGYLTPSEALAMLDDGAKPERSTIKQYLEEQKQAGSSNPTWFYFYPSREQMNRWNKF